MTSSSDRIDRIETLLEQFISASVADRQASNERMTRLEQSTEQHRQASNEQMTRIEQSMTASDQRMTRIEQSMVASSERMTRIEEDREVTDARVDVLVTCVDTLAVDVRQLVDYLKTQSGNGRSGG